jgi:hypothetical protein
MRVPEQDMMGDWLRRGQLMRLTVTQAVPAFDMGQGADTQGEYWLIHWPSTLGYCPLKRDLHAVRAGDELIIYDTGKASVIAFQGFDNQTLGLMHEARLFLTERLGEAFVHHPVQWLTSTDDLDVVPLLRSPEQWAVQAADKQ